MNRIEINVVWYVKEDTLSQKEIDLDPTHYDGCVAENTEVCLEAHRLLKKDGTPYEDCVSITYTDKRNEKLNDVWDNTDWMKRILNDDSLPLSELPNLGSNENYLFFKAFLKHLKDEEWL